MRLRILLAGLGLFALALGFSIAFPAPKLALSNTALVMRYPPRAALGFVAVGVGLGLVGVALGKTLLRVLALSLGIVVLAAGADRFVSRLEAGPDTLSQDGLFGRTVIGWNEVRRVEPGSSVIVVWGNGDTQIRVTTDAFTADERAVLDRTIARHVREARGTR